jgi:hypothetical protein
MLNGVSVTPNTPVSLQQITDIKMILWIQRGYCMSDLLLFWPNKKTENTIKNSVIKLN